MEDWDIREPGRSTRSTDGSVIHANDDIEGRKVRTAMQQLTEGQRINGELKKIQEKVS
jgi:hypothetical protein